MLLYTTLPNFLYKIYLQNKINCAIIIYISPIYYLHMKDKKLQTCRSGGITMKLLCKFAAYSMLATIYMTVPVYSQEENIPANENPETVMTFVMPELAIDAERNTYQQLISREQDEITDEKIKMIPQSNPVKLFRSQNSSISLTGGLGGSTVSPSVRGLDARYTNVTVDGTAVNTPWGWSSLISGFPMGRLKKITLANTGSAMVYGQNAVAGNINYSLPSGEDYEGFTLNFEIGGNGTKHEEVMWGICEEKYEHLVSYIKDEYDGTKRMTNGVEFSNRRNNDSFMYKGKLDLSRGWTYKVLILENSGSMSAADSWSWYAKTAHYAALRFDPWKMSIYTHTLEKDFGNESNMILRYSKYKDFSENVEYSDNEMKTGKTVEDGNTNVSMQTYDLIFNLKANDRHFLNLGVTKQISKDNHSTISRDYINKKYDNVSYFIADSIQASDKLNLHLAIRSDENFENNRDTSYSINTDYALSDKTTIGLGFSSTVLLPTIQDLYGAKGTYGNPNLKNEKAKNYEIRLSHKINDNWKISLAGYQYNIDDKIYTQTIAAGNSMIGQNRWLRERAGIGNAQGTWEEGDSYRVNAEKAKTTGFELAVNGKINDRFDTWFSYTKFNKSEYTENGVSLKLADIPDYRAVIGFEYHNNKTTALITTSLQGQIRETTNGGKFYPKVDSSVITDLSIRHQCNDDFAIYAKINNIGNDRHAILSQNYLNSSAQAPDTYWYEDGRTIIIGAELRCK